LECVFDVQIVIPNTHPYWHLRAIVERSVEVAAVPFSYYAYTPQTVEDKRSSFIMSVEQFLDGAEVYRAMACAGKGQELAMHSNLLMRDGRRLHLVMVDMSTSARAHLEKLRGFLGDNFFQKISWYSSGRSFHGYGESLLERDEWVQFMGLLLLANQPHLEPTVDPRWIGHRLLAGYASLRWTCNTSHYLTLPRSIEVLGRRPRIGKLEVALPGKNLHKAAKPLS
jgi:hypothetical protein